MLDDDNIASADINNKEEEFEAKMSDEKLISQIDQWEKESEELYTALKRVWDENLQYYKGVQTGVESIYGKQSKVVENRQFMSIETMIPIATSRLPDIVVKPGGEAEQDQMDARDLQDIIAYHFERVGIQFKAEMFLRDMLLKRYGVFKPCWNKEEDDVDVKWVDAKRIRVPKFGIDVQAAAFVIEDLEMSYSSIESFFGEAKAKKVLQTGFIGKLLGEEDKLRKKNFIIKEVWTNEYVCWRYGNEILKKEYNPYFEKGGENFFLTPKKPYVIKSLFQTEESLISDTDYIQQTKALQDGLNQELRMIENIARKVSNPALLIDSEVMSEEQAANITNEEGLIIYGKDAAQGTKIRFEAPGNVPQHLFVDVEQKRSTMDNIIGTHSTTRGEREGRETLGGRQLLREGDLGRVDLIARQLERALDEVAEYWVQLIKLFYTEEKSFTILGQDGVRFVQNFSGKKVGNVKPMVKAGSTLKEDEYAIQQKAIILWQNKAIGLKTLYKMLNMPNMQEAVDDWIQTTSGALLQGGGGGAGVEIPPILQNNQAIQQARGAV